MFNYNLKTMQALAVMLIMAFAVPTQAQAGADRGEPTLTCNTKLQIEQPRKNYSAYTLITEFMYKGPFFEAVVTTPLGSVPNNYDPGAKTVTEINKKVTEHVVKVFDKQRQLVRKYNTSATCNYSPEVLKFMESLEWLKKRRGVQ